MGFLDALPGIALIIFGFGVLIFVHEAGHFLAAKWAGIRTEAFAVGMGPVMLSWRKGIGVRLGSTRLAYEKRVRDHVAAQRAEDIQFKEKTDDVVLTETQMHRIGDQLGLGETEYSLRWFPIGGFVKMLGQEDANPAAVSDDPRSYSMCPIGKRAVVVSAGVIMNVLLAIVLFIWSFMVGVRFQAPVIGSVSSTQPAGVAVAENADEQGITQPGLQPGDLVELIDDKPARTFADIQIATAMAKPGAVLEFGVRRSGVEDLLVFSITPKVDAQTGLLGIGIAPSPSSTLLGGADAAEVNKALDRWGLAEQGVSAGMQLVSANGTRLTTFSELEGILAASGGHDVLTTWQGRDDSEQPTGEPVTANLVPTHVYQTMIQDGVHGRGLVYDQGLFGLAMPARVTHVLESSPNQGVLLPDDVIAHIDGIDWPRFSQIQAASAANARKNIHLTVLRDGQLVEIDADVDRKGMLGIGVGWEEDLPVIAAPVSRVHVPGNGEGRALSRPTPVAVHNPMAGARLESVDDQVVEDWRSFRSALLAATHDSFDAGTSTQVRVAVSNPTPGGERETMVLELSVEDVRALHELGWSTTLLPDVFDSVYTTISSEGNPLLAASMGFAETHKMIVMTYLTIDRLFRGSVGVEQLRGPVGIVHLGAQILPKGFMYFVFFMGMISVNLAVINFLPLPIVDGGLFLFLIYEKLKGQPPSLKFQNAATIVGLCLIGTIFLVTFYNDIARLLS